MLSKLVAAYKRNKIANTTIKQLSSLSDRELNDMGIARGDIWSIAHDCKDYTRVRGNASKGLV